MNCQSFASNIWPEFGGGEYHHDIPTGYHINCRGLHTFHLRSPNDDGFMGPFAGNIYSDAFHSTPVHMEVRWEKRGGEKSCCCCCCCCCSTGIQKRRNLFILNTLEQNTFKTHHSIWGWNLRALSLIPTHFQNIMKIREKKQFVKCSPGSFFCETTPLITF